MSDIPKLGTKDQLPPNDTTPQQTGRNGLVTFYPFGTDQNRPAVISINGDNGGIDIGGTRDKDGKLLLRDKWMTITYIIDGETGTASQSGDIVLYDAHGHERVRISGKNADLTIKSCTGDVIAHLDGKVGDLTLGGQGQDGDVIVANSDGKETIHLDGHQGDAILGGNGRGGDVVVRDPAGQETIHLAGTAGEITVGGNGQHGDVLINRGDGTRTIRLDGATGDITISGELVIKDWAIAVPDHVFAPAYKLPDLDELATYIGQNQHLPELPTADQVATQGLHIGEFCMLLLKRIEEMTLHAIRQERTLHQQSARLAELEQSCRANSIGDKS